MSLELSRLLYAHQSGDPEEYPVIELPPETRRAPPKLADAYENADAEIPNTLYEYRDGGRTKTIRAGSATLAVLAVLAQRSGVPDLTHEQVAWEIAGDTVARGRFRKKQVTASLTG